VDAMTLSSLVTAVLLAAYLAAALLLPENFS
jgi:K+-transporting ATPase KdpF subunit